MYIDYYRIGLYLFAIFYFLNMKNLLFFLFVTLFCCYSFVACTVIDCATDCGEHGVCNEMDGSCVCETGYATFVSGQSCQDYARNIFLGEWEAKDTLCSDSCRLSPYTVSFYPHYQDSTLFYVKNLATQVFSNPDSAVWLLTARENELIPIKNMYSSLAKVSFYQNTISNGMELHFTAVTVNDTLLWTTILRKK